MKRITKRELYYVKQVLASEFRSSRKTDLVRKAEQEFQKVIGSKFAIGFVNGTSTLHIALEALGVGPGDEVIVPPLTMSATTMAVLHAGATPIFADVDIETFQISPNSIQDSLTSKTKAIITVALYGGSPDYESIKRIANGIPVIEDNAEAIGTSYNGREIGTYGAISSYSFQSSKHLTAGEGGMLCTDNEELADSIRVKQSLGYGGVGAKTQKIDKDQLQDPDYERHVSLGWNYRMSELTAAVVLGQINRAENLINVRKHTGEAIYDLASKFDFVKPQANYMNATHSFWAAPLVLDIDRIQWKDFYNTFKLHGGKGIYSAWKLTYKEPFWLSKQFLGREKFFSRNIQNEPFCPNAEYLQSRILAFRTSDWTKKEQKKQLIALRKTLNQFQFNL
jgi:perosamine synthetase